ncbi:SNAP25 homologous protein SNAP33-like [Juglans microcarpa x Juglans regia]|uniref:SNAP25 homologous protein SNAP33-like n=1 Tax=Juglans microcarpa x Juglans regia TaxID=2249226 RepID=UPI001B7EFF69|nr:SNAP25 homologous protein SNAP33-like [Juglans microcarpa x Juglans regia]
MFGLKKSPVKIAKHNSVDPGYAVHSSSNPFGHDDKLNNKQKHNSSRRTSSESSLMTPNFGTNPFDDDERQTTSSSSSPYALTSAARNKYKNDFRDSGGLDNQSVQELENYAVYKAEENTKAVNSCLKIAEEIREDATNTLVTLHHQGEQITRTHMVATDIDQNLSRGEKLLGSLGGMFSKTWKPKKTRPVRGPVFRGDDSSRRKGSHLEQKERLGLNPAKGRSNTPNSLAEPTSALQKVDMEHSKQDDALSDLSNLLGELKEMAIDMGSEIESQNKALDPFDEDVDVLGRRVDGANQRARRLLGK